MSLKVCRFYRVSICIFVVALPLASLFLLLGQNRLVSANGDVALPENEMMAAVAAVDCAQTVWVVTDTVSLNDAITCFNGLASGVGTISITADITLVTTSTAITNDAASLLIAGNGYTIDGDGTYRVIHISGGVATLQELVLANGFRDSSQGGGLRVDSGGVFTLTESTITGSKGRSGGGIHVSGGYGRIERSTLSSNEATNFGGGALLVRDGSHIEIAGTTIYSNTAVRFGGGIRTTSDDVWITITNSTLDGNYAGESGGGLYANQGHVTLINTTVSANRALTDGGGILANTAVDLIYSSVVSNTADAGSGGGILNTTAVSVTLVGTLLAYNSDSNCSGSLVDSGYNLSSDSSCPLTGTGSITNTDPLLLPLADNGGETETHALPANSPAVDVVPAASGGCGTLYTADQRGVARPESSGCDIGAYEYLYCALTPLAVASESDLNTAIGCYNGAVSGETTISLTADIPLASNSTTINNSSGATLLIHGNGYMLDGNSSVRPLRMNDGQTTIDQLVVANGSRGGQSGGGIYIGGGLFTVTNSAVMTNATGISGGGIYVASGAELIVQDSEISNNFAGGFGGGVHLDGGSFSIYDSSVYNNLSRGGGGVALDNSAVGTIEKSAIYSNQSPDIGGGGVLVEEAALTVVDTVVYNNTGAPIGGGVENKDGVIHLINSTISGNGGSSGDGLYTYASNGHATTYLTHTTVISNSDFNVRVLATTGNTATIYSDHTLIAFGGVADCSLISDKTGFFLATYSLSSDGTCLTNGVDGNIVTSDPQIGALQDNGGETWSHLPISGSQVIDAIPSVLCTTSTDQREITRPQGNGCDIGAVEWANEGAVITTVAIGLTEPQTVTLSWSDGGANERYDLYRSLTPYSGHSLWSADVTPPVVFAYDESLTNYFYFVRAVGSDSSTADSNEVGVFHFILTPGD